MQVPRAMEGVLPEIRGSRGPYVRRDPEQSVLYQTIASNLETFLARQQQRGRPVPTFVEDEFRGFLRCGVLEYGFLRLRCQACGFNRLLAFSCKGAVSAGLVAAGAWPIRRRIWWTASFRLFPCGSGCCRCPTRYGTA